MTHAATEPEPEAVDVLVVGAGQAGLAMSEHLGAAGIPHLVLERDRIAERWRTQRWDSLVANGPAWHDRFPGQRFADTDPDGFPTRGQIVHYFDEYAERIEAPVRTGVEVTSVRRIPGRPGFAVQTTDGPLHAQYVVAATGPFQRPQIPPIVPQAAGDGPVQLHSSAYRNPAQLPDGPVLVVGAGSSGVQIADELRAAGREVHLSVGPHDRPPRSYRGRDFVWWLGVLGKWDADAPPAGAEHVTIAVSGAHGGHTVDFRALADRGIALHGTTALCEHARVHFADDLAANLAAGDASYLELLREADAYVADTGLDLPPEPEAHELSPLPAAAQRPPQPLDLSGVAAIIWATGYGLDYGWLQVDALHPDGRPRHVRGVSSEPGVYFLGLPWLSRRGSSFIWGVWHDARYLADRIATRRAYLTGTGSPIAMHRGAESD